jgi:hypothetical protein
MAFVVDYLAGDWSPEREMDEALFERGLRYGLLWDADVYLGMACERSIHTCDFASAAERIEKLGSLCDDWGYEFSRSNEYAANAYLLAEQRRLDEALSAVERWYDHRNEAALHVLALGLRARLEIFDDRLDAAENTLAAAARLESAGQRFPYHAGLARTARLALAVARVEAMADSGLTASSSQLRAARRLRRIAVASASKCARDRAETLRLAGKLELLGGDRSAALAFWRDASLQSDALGARADSARVWAEMGHALAGTEGDEWMRRSHAAFDELGLEWELERIEKIKRRRRRAA